MMEKAHEVSVDEPSVAHQAILFVLDVLIRNGQEMEIENLYNTFGDPTFTPQMLRAVGGNDQGLRNFLQRYPSLFTISGQTVRANSGADQLPSGNCQGSRSAFSKPSGFGNRSMRPDSSDISQKWDTKTMKEIEQEATVFFKKQMGRKEEEWLPIVSVAGHASQASPDIRKFVGPQNEFIHFLMRYPDIFLVRDEYCGIKGKADKAGVRFPPPSPPPKRRSSDNTIVARSTSFSKSAANTRSFNGSTLQTSTSSAGAVQLQLSPLEVKSVHYIMRLLHRCGRMLVQNVPTLLSRAPEPISKTIGQNKDELVQFFKLHSAIFQLHPDSCVSIKSDAVRALIHKDKSFTENSVFTSSGIVLRIFLKYGIINMENNEQVFFDIQSCQFESFGDLTCILHPGDRLWFNAVLGPKDGSTKWRSLKTWIKMKSQTKSNSSIVSNVSGSHHGLNNGTSHYELNSTSSSKQSQDDSQRGSPAMNLFIESSNISSSVDVVDEDDDLDQYQLVNSVESSDESNVFNGHNEINRKLNRRSKHVKDPLLNKNIESLRSTSMMDLRSMASSLPVLTSFNGRLEFVPIDYTSDNHFDSARICKQENGFEGNRSCLNGCIDPDTIRAQIHSKVDCEVSKKVIVDSRRINMSCQTISSGDILATNIFLD